MLNPLRVKNEGMFTPGWEDIRWPHDTYIMRGLSRMPLRIQSRTTTHELEKKVMVKKEREGTVYTLVPTVTFDMFPTRLTCYRTQSPSLPIKTRPNRALAWVGSRSPLTIFKIFANTCPEWRDLREGGSWSGRPGVAPGPGGRRPLWPVLTFGGPRVRLSVTVLPWITLKGR